jgi:hypothetical protein
LAEEAMRGRPVGYELLLFTEPAMASASYQTRPSVETNRYLGFHSSARFSASAIWLAVIFLATIRSIP